MVPRRISRVEKEVEADGEAKDDGDHATESTMAPLSRGKGLTLRAGDAFEEAKLAGKTPT